MLLIKLLSLDDTLEFVDRWEMHPVAFSHVANWFKCVFLEVGSLIGDEKRVNCHGLGSIDAYRVKNRVNCVLFGTWRKVARYVSSGERIAIKLLDILPCVSFFSFT